MESKENEKKGGLMDDNKVKKGRNHCERLLRRKDGWEQGKDTDGTRPLELERT